MNFNYYIYESQTTRKHAVPSALRYMRGSYMCIYLMNFNYIYESRTTRKYAVPSALWYTRDSYMWTWLVNGTPTTSTSHELQENTRCLVHTWLLYVFWRHEVQENTSSALSYICDSCVNLVGEFNLNSIHESRTTRKHVVPRSILSADCEWKVLRTNSSGRNCIQLSFYYVMIE